MAELALSSGELETLRMSPDPRVIRAVNCCESLSAQLKLARAEAETAGVNAGAASECI
jgi:hypothetical protein